MNLYLYFHIIPMTRIRSFEMWIWTCGMVVLGMAVTGNKNTDQFMSMTPCLEFPIFFCNTRILH